MGESTRKLLTKRIYHRLGELTPGDQTHPDLSLTDNFLWAIWEELQYISELEPDVKVTSPESPD